MKERPILFSGAMVRALRAGTKTQTRRVVKMKPHQQIEERDDGTPWPWMHDGERDADSWMACPYGQPGDRLWVRETWMDLQGTGIEIVTGSRERYAYGADTPRGSYGDDQRKCYGLKWRPSIHMPRAASRITLEITGVRVERLQDISFADAAAEGLHYTSERLDRWSADGSSWAATPQNAYRALWQDINGPTSWEANPWVWVVSFMRLP